MSAEAAGNPARPPPGVRLCALSDIADPGAKGFRFRQDDKLFAGFVVRKGGTLAGYVDSCPHAGWSLAPFDDLYLNRGGDGILCSGHGALFRIDDGFCVAGPCGGQSLPKWPVIVREGDILTA